MPAVEVPEFIRTWYEALPSQPLTEAIGDPAQAAVFSTDMIVGFCSEGPLASERVGSIVPANAVDTYHLPVETAEAIGAMAHHGEFFHQVFLYHMALNGIEVVRALS